MNAALRLLGAQALLGTARRAPEFPAADTPTGRLLQDLAVSGFGKSAGESPALNDAAGNSSDDSARLLLRGAGCWPCANWPRTFPRQPGVMTLCRPCARRNRVPCFPKGNRSRICTGTFSAGK